jgi:hypothetical protein
MTQVSTAHFKALSQHLTRQTEKTTKTLSQVGQCPGRVCNWAPPKHKSEGLPPEETYTLFLQDENLQSEYTLHHNVRGHFWTPCIICKNMSYYLFKIQKLREAIIKTLAS